MDDRLLRQNVIDELEYEPSIDPAHIGVTAAGGVVTLSGYVADYAQKLAAERAAWRVRGVRAIAEEIEIRFPGETRHSDEDIAQRALSVLTWNVLVPHDLLQVKVQDGWVTLTGETPWNYQREAAVEDVRKLAGVVGVSNNITLKPLVQAGDVKQRITDALKRHAEVEASHVQVHVRDGSVDIEGAVDNWDERQAVVRAAWSAPGVLRVTEHLRIG